MVMIMHQTTSKRYLYAMITLQSSYALDVYDPCSAAGTPLKYGRDIL